MERELLVRLAPCVNPKKIAALGIAKRALRALGVGTTELDQEDRRHRNALGAKISREVKPFSSDDQAHVLSGMGPHPELPASKQLRFEVPAEMLREVGKKIVRGCEYWLGNGRIIEPPYEIEIFFPRQLTEDVLRAFAPTTPVYLGPGFRVRRAAAVDDSRVAMYEIVVWDSLTIFGMVMPPDEEDSVSH